MDDFVLDQLAGIETTFKELTERLGDPDVLSDPKMIMEVSQERAGVEEVNIGDAGRGTEEGGTDRRDERGDSEDRSVNSFSAAFPRKTRKFFLITICTGLVKEENRSKRKKTKI